MKAPVKFLIAALVVVLVASPILAQPIDPGGGGDPDAPITGLEVILGAGALLGVRKLLQRRKIQE